MIFVVDALFYFERLQSFDFIGFIRLCMGVDVLLSFYAVFMLCCVYAKLLQKSNMRFITTNYIPLSHNANIIGFKDFG